MNLNTNWAMFLSAGTQLHLNIKVASVNHWGGSSSTNFFILISQHETALLKLHDIVYPSLKISVWKPLMAKMNIFSRTHAVYSFWNQCYRMMTKDHSFLVKSIHSCSHKFPLESSVTSLKNCWYFHCRSTFLHPSRLS